MSSISDCAPRRWGWLIASVALNLVLLGLMLAWVWGMHTKQPYMSWQRSLLPSMSAADAAIVQEAATRIEEIKAQGDALVRAQSVRLRNEIVAEPFDRAAMEGAINALDAARNDEQTAVGRVFLDEMTALSPAGRISVKAAAERQSHRWFPTRH